MNYHGSLDEHWGRYRIASVSRTVDGLRYELADEQDRIALTGVSRTSFTLIPDGPAHCVRDLHRRLAAVRRAAHLAYGEQLPEPFDSSIRTVPEVVAANRHAEAEHYLLSLEATVGCISQADFQRRAREVVVTTSDDSWSPWPQNPTPTPAPGASTGTE
ncbi:hypothetical protein [Saccharothrix syringae]|uniref:Uncharacterized protein n=1 Tax=Saccharothrix syringae TaxID=103733 RepID=A0A5Q0H393_SACSY|nr:hypothetical protein [Saccharothrix syringae]QFZ20553.1 hypothetical protein EKG83_26890 [Saccharothrix syringae]